MTAADSSSGGANRPTCSDAGGTEQHGSVAQMAGQEAGQRAGSWVRGMQVGDAVMHGPTARCANRLCAVRQSAARAAVRAVPPLTSVLAAARSASLLPVAQAHQQRGLQEVFVGRLGDVVPPEQLQGGHGIVPLVAAWRTAKVYRAVQPGNDGGTIGERQRAARREGGAGRMCAVSCWEAPIWWQARLQPAS